MVDAAQHPLQSAQYPRFDVVVPPAAVSAAMQFRGQSTIKLPVQPANELRRMNGQVGLVLQAVEHQPLDLEYEPYSTAGLHADRDSLRNPCAKPFRYRAAGFCAPRSSSSSSCSSPAPGSPRDSHHRGGDLSRQDTGFPDYLASQISQPLLSNSRHQRFHCRWVRVKPDSKRSFWRCMRRYTKTWKEL